jgi:hypothetical protein
MVAPERHVSSDVRPETDRDSARTLRPGFATFDFRRIVKGDDAGVVERETPGARRTEAR